MEGREVPVMDSVDFTILCRYLLPELLQFLYQTVIQLVRTLSILWTEWVGGGWLSSDGGGSGDAIVPPWSGRCSCVTSRGHRQETWCSRLVPCRICWWEEGGGQRGPSWSQISSVSFLSTVAVRLFSWHQSASRSTSPLFAVSLLLLMRPTSVVLLVANLIIWLVSYLAEQSWVISVNSSGLSTLLCGASVFEWGGCRGDVPNA